MAQFLGAFNDNLFKIVVSLLAVETATGAGAGRNLSIVGVVFILPFLLFSGYAGSLAAGRLSGDKVEPGLAPIGAIGMGVSAMLLSRSADSRPLAAICLAGLGFFDGLFAVPLNALLQQRSGERARGRIQATNNFLNTAAILAASGVLWVCTGRLGLGADDILLLFGVVTLASSAYVLSVVPEFLIRFSLWLLTHTVYRIRILGQEQVPARGPALLVCNHLSHADPHWKRNRFLLASKV